MLQPNYSTLNDFSQKSLRFKNFLHGFQTRACPTERSHLYKTNTRLNAELYFIIKYLNIILHCVIFIKINNWKVK